jgi:UDP:flavonoid glycosyltransferase YjiC (YdhE family)
VLFRSCSIYPQHQAIPSSSRIGHNLLDEVQRMRPAISQGESVELVWGTGADVLFQDPALDAQFARGVGFPYWDRAIEAEGEVAEIRGFIRASPGPKILVTRGSFVGLSDDRFWTDMAQAVGRLSMRAIFVGIRRRWATEVLGDRKDIFCVGFVPLSDVLSHVDAVVHHGGIGTLFGALRAGRAACAIPQAFDQTFNAQLLERVGAGFDGTGSPFDAALSRLIGESQLGARAAEIAAHLISATDATEAAISRILAR